MFRIYSGVATLLPYVVTRAIGSYCESRAEVVTMFILRWIENQIEAAGNIVLWGILMFALTCISGAIYALWISPRNSRKKRK